MKEVVIRNKIFMKKNFKVIKRLINVSNHLHQITFRQK